MSLLTCYHSKELAVLASDDRACVETPSGWTPLPARVPKFALLAGAIALGAVGRNDLTTRLLAGAERMVRAENLGLRELTRAMPQILGPMWDRRSRGLGSAADKLHVTIVGHDDREGRIRSFVWLSDDRFTQVETTADARNVFFSLGAFDVEDEAPLQRVTERLGALGPQKGPVWIADEMRKAIQNLSSRYPAIGPPAYFAAIDHRGLVALPGRLELPPSRIVAIPDAAAIATAGRMFVGSITTPPAGTPDTTGNNDGGSGAQTGWTNYMLMTATQINQVGTGSSVSNPNNAIDGDLTTYATLQVAGNSTNGNSARIYLSAPPGLVQKGTPLTLQILASIPTNTLNGNVASACFFAEYATDGTLGGNIAIPAMSVFPTNAGPPHTFALAYFTVSIPANLNPGNITLGLFAAANADSTSGTLTARVYDARLIAGQ